MNEIRETLREAYTLLVSAEPTLIRDAKTGPNETSLYYKGLLRDRVRQWLDPIRDDFDGWYAALAATSSPQEPPLPSCARGAAIRLCVTRAKESACRD